VDEFDLFKKEQNDKIQRYRTESKEHDANVQKISLENAKLVAQLKTANETIKILTDKNEESGSKLMALAQAIEQGSQASPHESSNGNTPSPTGINSSKAIREPNDDPQRVHLEKTLKKLHRLLDEERNRNNALKTVLLKFSDRFTQQDNDFLFDAGIILVCNL
jgi:hypothetical protein